MMKKIFAKDVLIVSMMTAALLGGFGYFLSPVLGLFCAGVFSLGYGVVQEIQRRARWERSMRRDLTHVKHDIERMNDEARRASADINQIKGGMVKAGYSLKEHVHNAHGTHESLSTLAQDLEGIGRKPRGNNAISKTQQQRMRLRALKSSTAANDGTARVIQSKDRAIKQTIKNAIDSKSMKVFSQSIVMFDKRKTLFTEVFTRIPMRHNTYMSGSHFIEIAKQSGYIADIDLAALRYALGKVKAARKAKKNPGLYFINISLTTLKHGRFMSPLLRALADDRGIAPFLVFELQESEMSRIDNSSYDLLRGLSGLGCRLSIDHVEGLDMTVDLLRELNVRFVKIRAALLINHITTMRGMQSIKRLKQDLRQCNIDIIVDHVEREEQVKALEQFRLRYAQGYLFDRPSLDGKLAPTLHANPVLRAS